jgi:ubiquinone/menaquinone biosynthesis C-methylase UbiE
LLSSTSDVLANKVKLNLGCGDKILMGYINVDVAESRKGSKPDLVSDITKLDKFADNSVDEILTVHVIEHFYYWHLPDVLGEWKRILKPGGTMITETPNLLFACQEIMKSPFKAALPNAQMSMWPLFGNPFEQDELMCHRWCFTPQTLNQTLTDAGFVNIRQEPAEYKLREPRDFRVVCQKGPEGE